MREYGRNKNFLGLESEHSRIADSAVVILPAPYEHTVSYGGGTRKGPRAILRASHYVEFYDDEFDRELCFDVGIATARQIKFKDSVDKKMLKAIATPVRELLEMGKFVVTLGGEHSISTAPILTHNEVYPRMSVLHFDAHSDFRESYEGSKYSHACFAARVAEKIDPSRITQVGIRAQAIEEAHFIRENGVQTFFANAIRRGVHGTDWAARVAETLSDEVYITFDVDYFDPAIMPATGTPEPDGFGYSETIDVIRAIAKSGRRVVGLDVVELAPIENLAHPDVLAARLIYKILNIALAESLPPYPRIEVGPVRYL